MEFETKLYNPAAQPEEWLIEHFVVRTKVFERLFEDIKSSTMEHPEQHYLIQGQRGMGKTTLLLRLKYEIEKTNELKDWLMPVFFNEESYDLTSLSSLWEKLLKYFDTHFSDGGDYYNATDKFIGSDDYEQKCYDLVVDILNNQSKKLVILFDNFGELFLDNLKERDSHRFREILMTSADIRIVAASSVVLESQNDYSEPFFDFFKIINLQGLSKDETFELIVKLQERSTQKIDVEANKARIETLSVLTGGVIRTIIMLYEILLNDIDGSAIKDLEKILDAVTPLYKHRMEDLKLQQRRIMDVIAKNWDAISVKEISNNIRENGKPIASKVVSAQLQELEKNNLVEKIKTSTKNNLYIVNERFFNIWYLMRHGDKTTQCRVKWLTRFLEMWYGNDEEGIHDFINGFIKKLKSGNYISSSAITITNALLGSSKINDVYQALLLDATENNVTEEERKTLLKTDEVRINQAIEIYVSKDYKRCVELVSKVKPINMRAIKVLGMCYLAMYDFKQSIYYLSQIPNIESDKLLSAALGIAYFMNTNNDLALPLLLNSLPDQENSVSGALGKIYLQDNKYDLAERFLIVAANNADLESSHYLIDILMNRGDIDKSIYYLLEGLKFHKDDLGLWGKLGFAYILTDRPIAEIEETFMKTINLNPNGDMLNIIYNTLLISYIKYRTKKEAAIEVVDILKKAGQNTTANMLFVQIWNGELDSIINELIPILRMANSNIVELNSIIMLLISKMQYHTVWKLFNTEDNLKEKLKPTYYALMYLLKDEYPDEYKKMGKELRKPVKDVLKEIEQFAIDYA